METQKRSWPDSLKNGDTRSCGCDHYPRRARYSLAGQRFGRLVAEEYLPGSKYKCLCDCGNEVVVRAPSLKHGHTKSCGCLRRETAAEKATKHGGSDEALYHVLNAMHCRCENPSSDDYKWYGAKGVRVCDQWARGNYPVFKAWALANGYAPGLTIDRKDPNGDYCPENCQWITIQEQQYRRRRIKEEHT